MKNRFFICIPVLLALLLGACGLQGQPEAEDGFFLYYLNEDQNRLETFAYEPVATETVELIDELITLQGSDLQNGNLYSLLPEGVTITGSTLDEKTLILDFSAAYKKMPIGREALVRGGLVREFLQIDGVDAVVFTVKGNGLTDSHGNGVGSMTTNSFVENSAETINAYQSAVMTLYFTDLTGTKLIPETRKVYYTSSEPLERAVVEELFKGPRVTGSMATFGTDIHILSVITQDDICYVNLDSSSVRITAAPDVSEEVQIYAIVNSLTDTCGVSKVQITLDGETNTVFRKTVRLSEPFSRKDSLIE